MRLIQPYPKHACDIPVRDKDRIQSPVPVYFIRHRYHHHAASSGYDRLCDYVGETIPLPKSLYWLGETLFRLPALAFAKFGGHFEYSRYDFTMELEVIRHFLSHHNSIYHFVYGEKSYHLLSRFAGWNGNKIVVTIHHPPEHSEWLFRSMEHFKKADFVTVVSMVMIPFWSKIVGADKVAYVPYAVDTGYFVQAEKREEGRPYRCIFIGYHERDFENLPALVSLILKGNPGAEFVMLSPDERCRAAAAVHPHAVWHRRVSNEEYLRYLQQSDLLVLPLCKSTTNTAVLEAMACGLPVITNAGGIEDYLSPRSSVVLPVGDVEGMADTVQRLLTDPYKRAAMSRAARAEALEFSWTATARQMAGIYAALFHS